MKNFKYILVSFFIIATLIPQLALASWWNPISWFSEKKQSEEQKPKEEISTVSESQTQYTDSTKTEAGLKAEVATLKASLDSLYTAHNNLVNDHNALLKYVNATVSPNKNVSATTSNSNLDIKVTDLEKKLNNVCRQVFSSLGGFGGNCPSTTLYIKETLESRIKKLEGGY